MSAAAQIESPETWNRLESSPEWATLTPSQKIFVTQFLATGSALVATKSAYKSKSESGNRLLSYEMAKNPTIVAALDVAAGKVKTERDELIDLVRTQLKSAPKGSDTAAKFAEQLERLINMKDGTGENSPRK